MAGKHSRSFFERKNKNVIKYVDKEKHLQKNISLTFKLIISATALALCLSLVLVCAYFVPGKSHEKIMRTAATCFESAPTQKQGLQMLQSYNSDIKGWLKIDGTNINYAVCQGENNKYYINHNQMGKKSRYGALFLSSDDTFKRKDDKNIVIYGNNMKDGAMFGTLKEYRKLNYYKQNPSLKLYYDNKDEDYIIFAVMLISSSADDVGNYNPTKSFFINKNDFDSWYTETNQRSLINTPVDIQYGDEILSLVTPAKDFEGARLVVLAKKSSEWQISQTDVTSAVVNPKIKYPKIWYAKRGLEYPY